MAIRQAVLCTPLTAIIDLRHRTGAVQELSTVPAVDGPDEPLISPAQAGIPQQ